MVLSGNLRLGDKFELNSGSGTKMILDVPLSSFSSVSCGGDGQIIEKKVGLTDSSASLAATIENYDRCATDDVQTAAYAVSTWEYHTSGPSKGKLAAEINALGKRVELGKATCR